MGVNPGWQAVRLEPKHSVFWFDPGVEYLVYAQSFDTGETVFTHSCSRTHQMWAGDPDPDALDEVTPVRGLTWGALKLLFR